MTQVETNLKPTEVAAGQHFIGYAYPSSEWATELGRGAKGCFVVEAVGKREAFTSYAEALESAVRLGTVPTRWSMDHPLNERFLEH